MTIEYKCKDYPHPEKILGYILVDLYGLFKIPEPLFKAMDQSVYVTKLYINFVS